jgi:hypothetical protein
MKDVSPMPGHLMYHDPQANLSKFLQIRLNVNILNPEHS